MDELEIGSRGRGGNVSACAVAVALAPGHLASAGEDVIAADARRPGACGRMDRADRPAVQQAMRRGLTSRARLETGLPETWQRRLAAALGEV